MEGETTLQEGRFEEDRTLRAEQVGMLAEMERK